MDRRTLLKGVAAVGAGLILPPTLAENVEAVSRRYWALDRTMFDRHVAHLAAVFDAPFKFHILQQEGWRMVSQEPDHLGMPKFRVALYPTTGPYRYAWADGQLYDMHRRNISEDQLRMETLVRAIDEAWSMR